MEQMSLGINFFSGRQIWPTKVNGKSRFGELSTDEIQQIVDNSVLVRTKKATKFGMRLFNGTYPLSFP